MELLDFLLDIQSSIHDELIKDVLPGEVPVSAEEAFTDHAISYMSEQGMTFEASSCHYEAKIGTHKVKVSGYSFSDILDDDGYPERLDLFVSIYKGLDSVEYIPDSEVSRSARLCFQFLQFAATGKLSRQLDETHNIYPFIVEVERVFSGLDSIRIFVITDAVAKTRNYAPQDVEKKQVRLEVMDLQRLYNHWQQGTAREELIVDFKELCGTALPSVWVPGRGIEEYDYALTAIPGESLRFLYEKYGGRILEANVRSFLGVGSKGVNKGIRDTLKLYPDRFMAYNNGIVVVADSAKFDRAVDGSTGILWLQGVQIVNGGQTTASMYFAKKKNPDIDLSSVRVPAKIIILRGDACKADDLVSNISKYANSQNVVKQSDLSANMPFHREVERISLRTYCPDGVGRWFYERSTGSYKVMLEKEASTPSQKRKLQEQIPSYRKITKPDLAKFLTAWNQMPYVVSLGSQKNFKAFMDDLHEQEAAGKAIVPDQSQYKDMIAKAILFKAAHKIIRPMFPAFQANITAYTVSVIAMKIGDRIDLSMIWREQSISVQMQRLISLWAEQVNDSLHRSSSGKMISEWAKKLECWWFVRDSKYTEFDWDIPEVSQS